MTDLLVRSKSPLFLFQTPPSSPPTSTSSLQTNSFSSDPNTNSNFEDGDTKHERRRRRNYNTIFSRSSIVKWSLGTSIVLWILYYWRRKLQSSPSNPKNILRHLFQFVVGSLKRTKKLPEKVVVEAPYSELLVAANNGQITKALVNAYSCIFQKSSDTNNISYRVLLPFQSSAFQTELLHLLTQGGCTNLSALPDSWTLSLTTPAIMAMPFVYLALLYKMMTQIHSKQNTNDSPSTRNHVCSTTTFRDVAGMDNAKLELMEVVQCLQFPKHYQRIGATPPRGILLHGPPGTGKTLLARAVAGEIHGCCFVSCSASEFVELLVGRGAARIRALFDTAKQQALQKTAASRCNNRQQYNYSRTSSSLLARVPTLWGGNSIRSNTNSNHTTRILHPPTAIIFIDEIDALAKSRTGGVHGNDEREQTLNQLLIEMDGFDSTTTSQVTILVLAATNRPELLDSALLRPGRFDRHVLVGCPDARGREDILRLHAKHVQLDLYTVDLEQLASSPTTHGFTGADLRTVVNEAAFLAIRDGRESVGQQHFIQAVEKVARMKHHC